MKTTHLSTGETRRRSGAALLLVLICLMVITTLIGAMLRHLSLANFQMKQRMHQIQATWLAESGVERAVAAMRQDADYSTEVWPVAAAELDGHLSGQVAIRVRTMADDDAHAAIDVVAIYPYPSEFGVKVRKRITVAKHKIPNVVHTPENSQDTDKESEQDAEE